MAAVYPQQKLSRKEKDADNMMWWKNNIDYHVDQSNYYTSDRYEMISLYKAAMGIVEPIHYKYVLNPYNSTDENLKNYPAQLRNYDIIIPLMNMFLGEKAEKHSVPQVVTTNPESINSYKEELDKAFVGILAQDFINQLNKAGVQTGVETQQLPEYQKVVEEYKNGHNDKRALFGQEAVDYIRYDLDLKDKYQEAFYDWLVVGRVYSYKDVYKNDLLHQIVPPIEIWHGTSATGFVEDSNWALRRSRYNINDLIDRFHEVLGDNPDLPDGDEISYLQNKFVNGNEVSASNIQVTPNIDKIASSSTNGASSTFQNLLDVYHVVWKSFEKVGILKYTDEFGQPQEMEVDEDYKLNKENGDISIEWNWINVVYEGYRLGEHIYKYMRPIQCQRTQLSNTSECKLPYNGRIGYSERNRITSTLKTLLPYQILYNIYHFRAELTLARNKDKLMMIPLGLLPDGWTEDKFLYFAESTGMLFFDETKPNASTVLNSLRAIDLNLGNYISQMRNLLAGIKEEAWDAVGMNRQRYGDVNASDGKGTNEQAIVRSSVISREMFRRFERFEESDMQGLLDCSKLAWLDGKKGMYINSDGRKAFLEANPEQHLETDYGVFYKDSVEEADKLKMAKQYAFGIAQKGGSFSSVMEVIDATNMAKIKQFVAKAEEIERQFQEETQKKQAEANQQMVESKNAQEDKNNATGIEKEKIKAEASINVALINKTGSDENGNPVDDSNTEMFKAYDEYVQSLREKDLQKQAEGLKNLQSATKTRMDEASLEMEKQKMENDLRIQRERNKGK